jgi:hypothetical protein
MTTRHYKHLKFNERTIALERARAIMRAETLHKMTELSCPDSAIAHTRFEVPTEGLDSAYDRPYDTFRELLS